MANTLFVGKVYWRFDELPSTNDYAAELLAGDAMQASHMHSKSKPAEGTVIRADRQSAGRGQFGSRWESEAAKNLTFSVLLYPNWLEAGAQFYLSMAVALALHDALHGLYAGPAPLRIKWPNDLYIGDKKTAGILIQNSLSGKQIQSSIVGIGLNVNQLQFDASLPNPTSLQLASGRAFDLDVVENTVLECLERRYLQLKAGQLAPLKTAFENLLFRRGVPSEFEVAGEGRMDGIILGVSPVGQLRLLTTQGERTFEVKEIRFCLPGDE